MPLEDAMWKSVLAGTTVLAIAGGSLVYAQQGPGGARADSPRWRPNAEDISALGDARIAGLKAGLKLTADQEKLWPAVEKAMRDGAKLRSERFSANASADRSADPFDRMQLRAKRMAEEGATLKAIADAAAPLYKSLDDGQKRRFVMLAHLEGRGGHHGWRERLMHRHGGRGGPDSSGGREPRPQ
jgi:zinc resistance-associated protein